MTAIEAILAVTGGLGAKPFAGLPPGPPFWSVGIVASLLANLA